MVCPATAGPLDTREDRADDTRSMWKSRSFSTTTYEILQRIPMSPVLLLLRLAATALHVAAYESKDVFAGRLESVSFSSDVAGVSVSTLIPGLSNYCV